MANAGCARCGGAKMHESLPAWEQPLLSQYGIYDLLTSESTTPYRGRFRATNVYVIGFRTPHERIFKVTDRQAAVAYAKTADPAGQLRMFRAHATQIGEDVGLALFGI